LEKASPAGIGELARQLWQF